MVSVLGSPGASLLVPLGKGNEGSGIRLTSAHLMLDAMFVLRTCESQLLRNFPSFQENDFTSATIAHGAPGRRLSFESIGALHEVLLHESDT